MKLLILIAMLLVVAYSSRPDQVLDWDIEQRDTWTKSHDRAPGLLAGLGAGKGAGLDKSGSGLGNNVGWGVIDIKGAKRLGGGAGAGIGSGQDRGYGYGK